MSSITPESRHGQAGSNPKGRVADNPPTRFLFSAKGYLALQFVNEVLEEDHVARVRLRGSKCGGDALSIAILAGMLRLRPEFVIVTVLGLLVVSTRTLLPNASVSGWIVSLLGYIPNTASWVCVPK